LNTLKYHGCLFESGTVELLISQRFIFTFLFYSIECFDGLRSYLSIDISPVSFLSLQCCSQTVKE